MALLPTINDLRSNTDLGTLEAPTPEEFELPAHFDVDAVSRVDDKPPLTLISLRQRPPPAPPTSPRPTPRSLPQSIHVGVLPLAIDEEAANHVRRVFERGQEWDQAGDYGLAYKAYCRARKMARATDEDTQEIITMELADHLARLQEMEAAIVPGEMDPMHPDQPLIDFNMARYSEDLPVRRKRKSSSPARVAPIEPPAGSLAAISAMANVDSNTSSVGPRKRRNAPVLSAPFTAPSMKRERRVVPKPPRRDSLSVPAAFTNEFKVPNRPESVIRRVAEDLQPPPMIGIPTPSPGRATTPTRLYPENAELSAQKDFDVRVSGMTRAVQSYTQPDWMKDEWWDATGQLEGDVALGLHADIHEHRRLHPRELRLVPTVAQVELSLEAERMAEIIDKQEQKERVYGALGGFEANVSRRRSYYADHGPDLLTQAVDNVSDEDAEFEYDDESPGSYRDRISHEAVMSDDSKPMGPVVYAYRVVMCGQRVLEYQVARRKGERKQWREALSLLGHAWSVAIEKSAKAQPSEIPHQQADMLKQVLDQLRLANKCSEASPQPC